MHRTYDKSDGESRSVLEPGCNTGLAGRRRYPVAQPDIGTLEESYVVEAVRSGWVSSIGFFVDRFERDLARFCEVNHAVALSNGTDAVMIGLRALGVGSGDEVLVPALTFAAVPAA